MITVTSTRDIFRSIIPLIVSDEANWKRFLAFASNMYTRSFHNVSLIYAQRSDASMIASYSEWQNAKRYVSRGTKGIAVINDNGDRPKIDYLYDIKDTRGASIPHRWRFHKENEKAVLNELSSGSKPAESMHKYIADEIDKVLYSQDSSYMETISTLCYYSCGQLEDDPEWIYRIGSAVKESAGYLASYRCCLDTTGYINLLPCIGMENVRILIYTLCDLTLKAAKDVLSGISKAVIKAEMKERGFVYEDGKYTIQDRKGDISSGYNNVGRPKSGSADIDRQGTRNTETAEREAYYQLQLPIDGRDTFRNSVRTR